MKLKMKDSTHIILFLIATLGLSEAEKIGRESVDYEPPLKYSQPSLFYKGKFLRFYPEDDQVHVYEEGMIPYSTKTRNVLFPKPKGNITDVYSPIKDKLIVVITNDGKRWIYERLKLRRTEESPTVTPIISEAVNK